MIHKVPHSVQLVVFARASNEIKYLLLRRLERDGGFWQTLTGALESGETDLHAAVRELREETGLIATPEQFIDLRLINRFRIAPQWRPKYAPDVTHNEEVCFAFESNESEIAIDCSEHDAWLWTDYETALGMLYWESSKRALARAHSRLESGSGIEQQVEAAGAEQ
jgi:dihydroneopterin triphosphate diphosphatase